MFWYKTYRHNWAFSEGDAPMAEGTCNREELESIAYDARMSGWVTLFGPTRDHEAPTASKELSPEMAGLV